MSKADIMRAIRKNIDHGFYQTDGRIDIEKVRRACHYNGISFEAFMTFNYEEGKE